MQDNDLSKLNIKKFDQKKLDDIFANYSKTDHNYMTFNEYLVLVLDKNMVDNRTDLSVFLMYFQKNIESQNQIRAQQESNQPPLSKSAPPPQALSADQLKSLDKNNFFYILVQLSELIFPGDSNRLERMFNELLIDRVSSKKQDETPDHFRVIQFDDTNKRILQESVVQMLVDHQTELQTVYSMYYQENLKRRKIMLTWKELKLQNKRLSTFGLVKYLKEIEVIPNLISIEHFEDIMLKMIPQQKYYTFYHTNRVRHMYEHSLDKDIDPKPEGDPMLSFHEMVLILARIGVETWPKEQADKKMSLDIPILAFFKDHLHLRSDREISEKKRPVELNKAFLKYLRSQMKDNVLMNEDMLRKKQENEQQMPESGEEEQEKMKKHYDKVKQRLLENQTVVDKKEVYKVLDQVLPSLPEETLVPQREEGEERTPMVIGEQLPKPPADKGQKQNKQAKKGGSNKDQVDFKKVNWSGVPSDPPGTSLEHQVQHQANLIKNSMATDFQRATLSQVEVGPCLIKEVLYPFDLPEPVRPYIEAAIIAHNQLDYLFSLENYASARKEWLKATKRSDLTEQVLIYFEFVEAQVYDSIGQDMIAFSKYYLTKSLADKLSFDNPDRALPFSGMGCALFSMEEYELSLRCFLKARELREKFIGEDTVDTATIYNNLGCCFMTLGRNREALAYFKIAAAIFSQELGPSHSRSLTSNRNVTKCNKRGIEYPPEFSKGWVAYVEDPFSKAQKKKSKKKKK